MYLDEQVVLENLSPESILFTQLLNEESNGVINNTAEIDIKLLSKLIQRRLMITIDVTKAKDEVANDFKIKLHQLFAAFGSKVSEQYVNHITQYIISKYPLLISVSTIDVFLFKTILDIDPVDGGIRSASLVIVDDELFETGAKLIREKQFDTESLKTYLDSVYQKIEYNITDYYYGLALKTIVLALSLLNKSKAKNDFTLHLLVTEILTDLILRGFGKRYTSGLNDTKINLTKTVILYLLLTHYFDFKPTDALELAAKLIIEQYSKIHNISDQNKQKELLDYIINTIKSTIPKYEAVTDIKYLGLYLEKLGIVYINATQFLIEFSRKFKRYYSYVIVAYPYLVATIIASLFPITDSPDIGNADTVKKLEEYVFNEYVRFVLK